MRDLEHNRHGNPEGIVEPCRDGIEEAIGNQTGAEVLEVRAGRPIMGDEAARFIGGAAHNSSRYMGLARRGEKEKSERKDP